MAAFDGSIRIDTKVDEKGFNKGVQGMSKSLGGVLNVVSKIAKVMAAAFIGGSIINSLRGVTQSFDIMGSAIGEKFKPLTDALATLKGAFVNLIVQAFIPLIPYIVSAVEWFTKMLFTVTQVVAALFGYKQTVGNIMTKAASDAKKSAKEVKGALAAFDQINVLSKQAEPVTGAETGPTATPAPMTVPQELIDKVQALKEKVMAFLQSAIELFEKLKKIVVETFEKITTWIKENPEKFKTFLIVLGLLVLAFLAVAAVIWIITTAMSIYTAITGIAAAATGLFTAVLWLLTSPIGLIILAIIALIAIIVLLILNWDTVKEVGKKTLETLINAVLTFVSVALGLLPPLKEGFGKALDWIKEKFISIWTSIKDFVRGVIDGIIGYIAGLIQTILDGIAIISGVSGAGAIGGASGIANLRPARAPGLATGAVIPPNAQFAAILGDQRSGRNIEAPEGLIRQIVREETANQSRDVNITFEGTMGELIRILKPKIDQENRRVGGSLVR